MTISLRAASGQGNAYTLQLRALNSSSVTGGTHTFAEDGSSGEYFVTPTGTAKGRYRALVFKGNSFLVEGTAPYSWSGTEEDGLANDDLREMIEAFLSLLNPAKTAYSSGALANTPTSNSGSSGSGGGLTAAQDQLLTLIAGYAKNANAAAVGEFIKNEANSTAVLYYPEGVPAKTFDLFASNGTRTATNVFRRVPR